MNEWDREGRVGRSIPLTGPPTLRPAAPVQQRDKGAPLHSPPRLGGSRRVRWCSLGCAAQAGHGAPQESSCSAWAGRTELSAPASPQDQGQRLLIQHQVHASITGLGFSRPTALTLLQRSERGRSSGTHSPIFPPT